MLNYIKRLIILIISLLVFLFDRALEWFLSLFKITGGTCVILYYHAVNPQEKKPFARQLDDLLRWTKTISISDIDKIKDGGRYCAITFDDGFTSVLDNALPELSKRNIPAALFIPSGCLGLRPPWLSQRDGIDEDVVMTTAQLNNLDRNMFLIGSHGITHQNLLQIDIDEARKEIIQSKGDLERITNRPVETISFPHGAFNELHIDAALQAGYRHAYSILPELIYSDSDSFVRGRVKADPSDWRTEFRLKLFGAYRWLPRAFAIKRKLRIYANKQRFRSTLNYG